jgi:hypothetical protein
MKEDKNGSEKPEKGAKVLNRRSDKDAELRVRADIKLARSRTGLPPIVTSTRS